MDDTPPPTDHVLKPHHVGLLTIFMLAFKEPDSGKLPPPFLLHLYRGLLNEVSEVTQPKSYRELVQMLSEGPKADADESQSLIAAFQAAQLDLETAEQMTNFFSDLQTLFVEKNQDEFPVLMRRSLFGYFCRRCFISFIKLSFSGVVKLQRDYRAWCDGDNQAGYEPVQKDQLNNADLLIFKTQADRKSWAKPEAYEVWEKGQVIGDENIATENLRRFFEQHFHESNDSGVRQHALLNLVRMHYLRGETVAARKLLSEAIAVARTSGDRITLQHCISMLHRLPPTVPGRKPALNEIQPDLHPLEILFDVKKLLDEKNEQPLSAAFEKIIEAVGLYDHWLDVQLAMPVEAEQWAQHAVQSIVWSLAGCDRLASIEEDVILSFTKSGGEDNNRINVLLNRAYKQARQGAYERALSMLLEPNTWRGLSLNDYVSWAQEIWQILTLRATRRGQDRLYRELLLPHRPPEIYNSSEHVATSKTGRIRSALHEVIETRRYDQGTAAIEQLLKALWHSEFLSRLTDYRTGIILLADINLEFGLSKRSRQILDEIMPQIINGNDLEQRAFACFTLARCIMLAGDSTKTALREALPYILISEADFQTLEMYDSLLDVQYFLSVVYHNLNMEREVADAMARHFDTQARKDKLERVILDDEIRQILEVVNMVGAALADR